MRLVFIGTPLEQAAFWCVASAYADLGYGDDAAVNLALLSLRPWWQRRRGA